MKQILDTWAYNRNLYTEWLVFPYGEERTALSWSTDEWEPAILNALLNSHR